MRIGRYSPVSIAAALLALVALLSASVATADSLDSSWTEVAALLIGPAQAASAQAAEAKPLAAAEDLEWKEFERFITRNPGTMLGGVALPIILLLTILARRRHYLWCPQRPSAEPGR